MDLLRIAFLSIALTSLLPGQLELTGKDGPGEGQKVVFLAGDEEYRSEESCPLLAKILAERLGYDCTVLFSMSPDGSYIDPNNQQSLPGLEAIREADLLVVATRFRQLDAASYRHLANYLNEGKPVIGFRTATHAFTGDGETDGFAWKDFGPRILGEGWVNHHGQHKVQGTRGVIEEDNADHPIITGVSEVFGPSDVYGIERVSSDNATILMRGAVTASLAEDSKPVVGAQNDPMMPLAWLRSYTAPDGETTGEAFCTTMGASVDFENGGLRRLFVNAVLFLTEHKVPQNVDVSPVDPFLGSFYGFIRKENYFQNRNLQPADYKVGSSAATGSPEPAPESWRARMTPVESRLPLPAPDKGSHLVLLGNGLADGFQRHGSLEAQLQTRFPERKLVVRNFSHPGYTPGFRPHSSRSSQWAFPGADQFNPDKLIHYGKGHYPSEDEWLTILETDTILAFFGFNESFAGEAGLENFRQELAAFITHTREQNYNGESTPRLILASPIAPATWIRDYDQRLADLDLYSRAMKEVAEDHGVGFVDLFHFTHPENGHPVAQPHGTIPDAEGYDTIGRYLSETLFGSSADPVKPSPELVDAILDKNWFWQNDYRMPNGVHVYGRRYAPFGKDNYPEEIRKTREMTHNRDRQIWAIAQGKSFDLAQADAETTKLHPIPTNYQSSSGEEGEKYLYAEEALATFDLADGFEIELFASEQDFPNLANPAQISFDNEGRLWVATMPSYPHYRPGAKKPDDKILIYEDTDDDGRADQEIVFADGLSLPMGFELTSEGVYVSQAPHLVLLQDRDGDDICDHREIVLTGFDHHDTHHAISGFCADPSGAIMMGEGFFLHSNVETMDSPVPGIDGGFYRYNPRRQALERTAQLSVPNPWGIAFDRFGQDFFLYTSSPNLSWMLPVSVKPNYASKTPSSANLIPDGHNVRPTSGLEFVSSRHFPPEMQGDILLGNTIGFLGIKQHQISDDGTGYATEHRQDLLTSSDGNFRPVDLEFAPDGSLYLADWHNILVGHMQHSARDPLRDHVHGRIYRITCKDRPLLEPAKIADASIEELLENLKLPEERTRYRTRRELRGRTAEEVIPKLNRWIDAQQDERILLEGLWVSWGLEELNIPLLKKLLSAGDFHVRAAAVRVLRYHLDRVSDSASLLATAAADSHGRVRLEAIVAASWLDNADARRILEIAASQPNDHWSENALKTAQERLANPDGTKPEPTKAVAENPAPAVPEHLSKDAVDRFLKGHEIYHREGHCTTCHQPDGQGLPAAGFPPLAGTKWVNGDEKRLIKITLHGLMGPLEVKGVSYPGQVPMTPFGGMLDDEEIASVLTYVRNSFGNQSSPIQASQVKTVREATKEQAGFYQTSDLQAEAP